MLTRMQQQRWHENLGSQQRIGRQRLKGFAGSHQSHQGMKGLQQWRRGEHRKGLGKYVGTWP